MNKTLYLIAGALLAVGASSCSSDEPAGPEIAQKDETRYIRVNILNPTGSSSRADFDGNPEFEAGTTDENHVETIYMDFYDEDGNFISRSFPSDMTETDKTGTPTPNVGKILSKVVKVGIEEGKGMPAYVMCYLNPVSYADAATQMTDLRLTRRPDYKNSAGHYAMNNSCYYGVDPNKSKNAKDLVKISGTPIGEAQLFNSITAAEEATDEELYVDIYVERYAAKVKFTLNTADATSTTSDGISEYNGDNFKLKFKPEAWTINAVENDMYAVKNFSLTAENLQPGGVPPILSDIDNALDNWKGKWNDPSNHRSYWACSPGYFATTFPRVADDIVDTYTDDSYTNKVAGNEYGAGLAVNDYYLKYYSYNQITGTSALKGNKNFAADGSNVKPCLYALETTMTDAAFNSGNPKAAVPAVLVVGNYKVTYGESNTELADNTTFYLWEGGIYFGSDVKDALGNSVSDAPAILDALLHKQSVLYTAANEDSKLDANNYTSVASYLAVKHPVKAVRGTTAVPSRYVTLQLKELPTGTTLYTKSEDGKSFTTVNNIDDVNKALWRQMNVAEAYTNGKCFYYIPIRHLRWTEDAPAPGQELETNGVINWGNLRPGDLGLVRNHVYDLAVTQVKGLATGIENLDYPILPAADNQYYIKYRINILNWRIVPPQGGIIL